MNKPLLVVLGAALLILSSDKLVAVEILEDTVSQTYAVDTDASISISNADGSIRIYAADVKEITLSAIKKAYTPERLRGIEVVAKADSKSLVVTTKFAPQPGNWSFKDRSGTVEYTLIVPASVRIAHCNLENGEILVEGLRGGRAKAHLVNGWLAGHNCFADLDLSIVNGRLDVAYDWWENKQFVATAESVNGSIRALLPSDASLTIEARSGSGHVASALPLDEDEPKQTRVKIAPEMRFDMNEPDGRSLRLHATNGNIRIDKAY